MTPPLAALPAASAPGSSATPPPSVELANGPAIAPPSQADSAAFAQAIADMQAAMPQPAGVGHALATQFDQLGHHLNTLQASLQPGATQAADPKASAATQMQTAMSHMQDAYTLAIETTLVSRGSTESTKIFNTLLKGQ